jgi:hypothetical protein
MISSFLQRLVGVRATAHTAKKGEKRRKDKFVAWLERNPTGTFEQFYADTAVRALARGKIHSSLGPALKPGRREHARRVADEWLGWGIRPSDIVVDYGCGTLRIGRLLIEFLDADRYVGLDLDDRILAAGRNQLSVDLLALKRPLLEVISGDSLCRTAARQPKWVCSKGVLQHVPPAELGKFFKNLSYLIRAGATGLLRGKVWETSEQRSSTTWGYTLGDLQASAARSGIELRVVKTALGTTLVLQASN